MKEEEGRAVILKIIPNCCIWILSFKFLMAILTVANACIFYDRFAGRTSSHTWILSS
jgi:hypothetical protein